MKNGKGRGRQGSTRKSSRRRSREFALQGLYQWQLARKDPVMIAAEVAEREDFGKADTTYFRTLLNGAIDHADELEARIAPHLDRKLNELSPIERSILLLGGFELMRELEVPYRVVINEAVELAKVYGGTDGHKFVNGVMDKLAAELRQVEVSAERAAGRRGGERES
ncbi:MAG: transcription antitermination factor NusB [Burkholderiales bacterium]